MAFRSDCFEVISSRATDTAVDFNVYHEFFGVNDVKKFNNMEKEIAFLIRVGGSQGAHRISLTIFAQF